jgi:NAD(P)-dependent dehydrogenase (short-subunit alcohol dehydrogenase family)
VQPACSRGETVSRLVAMSTPIAGKVVLISGASSGIGRMTALALGRLHARVALASRREELLHDVAREVGDLGGEPLVVPTDVADDDQIRGLVRATIDRWERIDIVIGSAGIWHHSAIEDTSLERWQEVMRIDFLANVSLTLAALPHMGPGGQFIFINSLEGKRGVPFEGAYTSAKHALTGFASVARQEFASRGIAVTGIHPGRIDTALIERLDVPSVQRKGPAGAVASAVVSAIRRPRPEVYVPAVRGRLYAWFGTLAPAFTDRLLAPFHLEGRMD